MLMKLKSLNFRKPLLIAGPCSAETEEQVIAVAEGLKDVPINYYRAGIWKPRTRPNSFEGVGKKGLAWLKRVRIEYSIPIITEVATPEHLDQVMNIGIDAIWIGARTTVNPFSVQALAEAARGLDIPIFIKNPIHADLGLWIGAFERFYKEGATHLAAIHRGFSVYGETFYRNKPLWQIPIELKRQLPDITLICDNSHICGRRDTLLNVAQEAVNLNYDGLMTEVHIAPDEAWSDAKQQIKPPVFDDLVSKLDFNQKEIQEESEELLLSLRSNIDDLDERIIDFLVKRMEVSKDIGQIKKDNHLPILQQNRWNHILTKFTELGISRGLSPEFIQQIFKAIHQESIRHQQNIVNNV